MKRFFNIIAFSLALICLTSLNTFASSGDDTGKVIFTATEIKDDKVLKERAENGITDDKHANIESSLSTDKILNEDGTVLKLKLKSVKSTAQKLKTIKYDDGRIKESFVATAYADCILEKDNSQDPNSFNTYTDSTTKTVTDPGQSYQLGAKIFYNVTSTFTRNGQLFQLYDVTEYEGSLTDRFDTQVIITQLDVQGYNTGHCYADSTATTYRGYYTWFSPTRIQSYPVKGYWYCLTDD